MPTMQRNPAGGVIDPRNFGRGAGTVRPPAPVPGFQDGGYLDDDEDIEGQGTDDAMLDPMQFVSSALNYGKKKYGIPTGDGEQEMGFDDGGVVPTMTEGEAPNVTGGGNPNATDPRQAMAYLSGDGAVSPEIAQALEQKIDPQGQMDPTQRAMAAIGVAPTDEARFGLLQHYRTKYNAYTGAAKAALQQGDMGGAAQYATMAMDAVPNGERTMFAPAQGGLAMISKPSFGGQRPQPQQQSFARGGYVQSFNNGDLVEEEEDEEVLSHMQPEPQADPPDVAADAPDVAVPEQEPLAGPAPTPELSSTEPPPAKPEFMPAHALVDYVSKSFDDWLQERKRGFNKQWSDIGGIVSDVSQEITKDYRDPNAGRPDDVGLNIKDRLRAMGILGPAEQYGPPEPFGPPAPAEGVVPTATPAAAPVAAPRGQQLGDTDIYKKWLAETNARAEREATPPAPRNRPGGGGGTPAGVIPTDTARRDEGDVNPYMKRLQQAQEAAAQAFPWVGRDAAKRDAFVAQAMKELEGRETKFGVEDIKGERARDVAEAQIRKQGQVNDARIAQIERKSELDQERDRARAADKRRLEYAKQNFTAAMKADDQRVKTLRTLVQANPKLATDQYAAEAAMATHLKQMNIDPKQALNVAKMLSGYDPETGDLVGERAAFAPAARGVVPTGGGGDAIGQAAARGMQPGQMIPWTGPDGRPWVYVMQPDGRPKLDRAKSEELQKAR